MSQFRDNASEFERAGAQVLAVNVDSHFCHQAFSEKLSLSFPLLSDFNRQVIPRYVGYYEDVAGYKQVGRRAVFVVDRKGVIRYRWISETEPGKTPDVSEVLKAVQSAGD